MTEVGKNIAMLEDFYRKFYYDRLLEAVREDQASVVVDFRDLDKFDPILADILVKEPESFFSYSAEAISNIDLGTDKKLVVRIENIPDSEKIRIKDMRSEHIGKFIKVDGMVRRASEVKPELQVAIFECPDCGERIEVMQLEKMLTYPSGCDCGKKRGFRLIDRKLHDTRYVVLEDPFETTVGEKPGELRVFLKDDLTTPKNQRKTDPGARLEMIGIVKELTKRINGRKTKQLDIFLECNFFKTIELELEEIEITEEDEKKIKELAKDPKVYDILIKSIAPSMYGLTEIKESMVLQLFGGVPQILPDGTRIRGDIHILLVGDPAAGKTQLLKLMANLVPRGRYVSGKGTTAAGLTATVTRDEEFMGGWVLEAGAIVLSNKSIISIDEFDKMSKEDQINLHEAMSTQSYHPDTKIDLADGSQRKIKDVVEELLEKYKFGVVKGEDCLILKVPENEDIKLLATNFNNIFPKKPTRVSKHLAPPYLYKIKSASGREITVTPEHPYWTIKNGEIICKRADSIEKGDWIPVPLEMPIKGEKQKLDIFLEKRKNTKHINVPIEISSNLYKFFGYLVSDCGYELNRGIKNGINFTNTNPILIEDFRNIMTDTFGLDKVYLQERFGPGKKRTSLRYTSSELVRFLRGMEPNFMGGYNEKKLPNSVLKGRKEDISLFLKKAFDGDGGNIKKERGFEVVYTTSSKELAFQISDFLLRFGITSKIRESKSKNRDIFRVAVSGESNIKKFLEEIGFTDKKFESEIEEYIKRNKSLRKGLFDTIPEVGNKIFKILKTLNISQKPLIGWTLTDYKNNKMNFTRQTLKRILPKIEDKYMELLEDIKLLETSKSMMKLRRIRKKFGIEAKEISNRLGVSVSALYYREKNSPQFFEEHKPIFLHLLNKKTTLEKDIEFLKSLVFGDIGWVQVKEIKKEKNEDVKWVYDVTVPGEIFISNGLVLHNTVSISKATIQATLPAQTAVMAGANPKFSRFDPMRPISEQIDIPDTLLSRFDLKFVLRDVPSREKDESLVDHVIKSRISEDEIKPLIDKEFFKKYIGYVRKNVDPKISRQALAICKNFFVELRSKYAGDESAAVPLTLRQFEALIRMAEASAKIRLSEKVSKEDAQRAIKLMKISIKQLGYDPDTGKIDIDRVEGGVSSSKRGKIRIVMDALDELEKTIGRNIPVSDLISALEEEGIDEHMAEAIIREMKSNGTLFEPRSGYVQRT